jgi:hypothetical protein
MSEVHSRLGLKTQFRDSQVNRRRKTQNPPGQNTRQAAHG